MRLGEQELLFLTAAVGHHNGVVRQLQILNLRVQRLRSNYDQLLRDVDNEAFEVVSKRLDQKQQARRTAIEANGEALVGVDELQLLVSLLFHVLHKVEVTEVEPA